MYHKADYDSMRQNLRQDWDMLFENMTTNQMWSILQSTNKYVLTGAAKIKPVWMFY